MDGSQATTTTVRLAKLRVIKTALDNIKIDLEVNDIKQAIENVDWLQNEVSALIND